jgi:hypothetical protein
VIMAARVIVTALAETITELRQFCESMATENQREISAGASSYRVLKSDRLELFSDPSSTSAPIAARAILVRSTPKNLRNEIRVSLRPKPSVPSVTYRRGTQVRIKSATALT